MKFYRSTKIRFFTAHFALYGGLLYIIYLPQLASGVFLFMIGALLLSTFPEKREQLVKSINFYQFFNYLAIILLFLWFLLIKDNNLLQVIVEFVQENKRDFKFLGLIGLFILTNITIHYQRLKELTPKDIVEYYEQ